MEIKVKAGILRRLMYLNWQLPPNETREWLRSVWLERRGGHVWIGSTNSIFAAIQYLGNGEPGDDGFAIVGHDNELAGVLNSCDPDIECTINEFDAMSFCSIALPNYQSSRDMALRNPDALQQFRNWRDWFPDETPSKIGKPMFVDVDGMTALVNCSPSGHVIFPKITNGEQPVIVRDRENPDWCGVFFARPATGIFLDGATLPAWIEK